MGKVATVTIVDDESAFQFSAPTFSVKEGTPNAVVTVLRTGTLTVPATVTYTATPGTAQPGTDFTPVSGLLSFPANTPSKTFNVPIVNNTRLDGTRSVLLALGNPTGGAQLGTVRTATLTIDDDEQAGTFRFDKDAYTVLETAGFVTVNVLRSGLNLTGNVSVNLVATDGTAKSGINYGAPPTTLIFAAGEITKPVKVPILRDFVVTGPVPQKFTLALSEPSSGATLGAPATATRDDHRGRRGRPGEVQRVDLRRQRERRQRGAHGGAHRRDRRWRGRSVHDPRRHRDDRGQRLHLHERLRHLRTGQHVRNDHDTDHLR